jgi:predicted neutral ceramidase superfamily lipid hydrolase
MHKIIASAYSGILTVLNIVVIIAFARYIYIAAQSFQYAPNNLLFALLAFAIYIIIVGLFSVIISMHQNLTEMKDTLQKLIAVKQLQVQSAAVSEPLTLTDRKEPSI